MKFIGQYKEFCPNHHYPSMRDSFNSGHYAGQNKIVRFLLNGKMICASAGIPKDVFTGKRIPMEKIGMENGEYTWFNTLAYYVENYNLRLPEDVENYILNRQE